MLGGDENGVLFKDFAWESWKDRYGTSPPWGPKEFKILHEARHRIDTEQVARDAWAKYLNSTDEFYTGHEPGKFLSSLSRWVARSVPRMRRDKMQPDDIWKQKADALIRLHGEVRADSTIPESEHQNEVSRRFRLQFPS